jgi:hypothetical protein
MIIALGDQNLYTGLAYALALRYNTGCNISAYHYNIVTNLLLLMCVSHVSNLMASKKYWKYSPYAAIRIGLTVATLLTTGMLLRNQNSLSLQVDDRPYDFPTVVTPASATDSSFFLPAACFQDPLANLSASLAQAYATKGPLFFGPGTFIEGAYQYDGRQDMSHIQGWQTWIAMTTFYACILLFEAQRYMSRGKHGWRVRWRKPARCWMPERVGKLVFGLFLILGVVFNCMTLTLTVNYIYALRAWVDRSGWVAPDPLNNQNPESEVTTLGQMVTIVLGISLILGFYGEWTGKSCPCAQFLAILLTSNSTLKKQQGKEGRD